MSSSFEKSVKGGTKVKLAPPKSKYVEHILIATQSESGVAEVFRTLTHRLRDSTWTVTFKSLIIVHLMIKEGSLDVTLNYLSAAPKNRLAINNFTDVQTQGLNIRRYSEYLLSRAQAFASSHCDYVRSGEGRMKRLTVDKGLLRETELIQDQIRALVKCDLLSNDVENEISLTAFRLLTRDLLDLYNVENEAVMKVLSHYFEMSKPDAERAIRIYKKFCTQTEQVVQYLGVARQYEHATRLEIPRIKHAPTGLAKSLQDYLNDPDFDVNRRQYLAEQEAKRTGKPMPKPAVKAQPAAAASSATQSKAEDVAPPPGPPPAKGPAPDLIDFFESIEQNQTPMAQPGQQYQQQPTGYAMQQQQPYGYQQDANGFQQNGTNPFLQMQQQQQQPHPQPIQTDFTGAGFGGYGPQPHQQFVQGNAFAQEQQQQQQQFQQQYVSPIQGQSPAQMQPQQTNPFRQSTMPTANPALTFNMNNNSNLQRQATNPFARNTGTGTPPMAMTGNAFAQQPTQPFSPQTQSPGPFSPHQTQSPGPLQGQQTGTNPFARSTGTPQQGPTPPMSPPNALQMQPTGSTNPFRQSAFVNQQTGQGWQHGPQGTVGGFENMETIPVFPRPAGGGLQTVPEGQGQGWS
jgi:hypothetical protein